MSSRIACPGKDAREDRAIVAIRTLFEGDRAQSIDEFLHDEIILRPPTYGKSWTGKPLVKQLLIFASTALEQMHYTHHWQGDGKYVLRFDGQVDGEPISGVDILTFDQDGLVIEVEIFARPPRAVLKLRDAMGTLVRGDLATASLMGLTS